MSKVYTPKMRQAIGTVKIPHEFIVDIVEYDFAKPYYVGLRFYESQWREYSEYQRAKCIEYLVVVKDIIEAHGVGVTIDPCYDMPGVQRI